MTSKSFCLVLIFFLNCNSYILQKIFNLDYITNENNGDHNSKGPYISDHPYRMMLIIGGSGLGKRNTLLNLIKEQDSESFRQDLFVC